MLARMLGCTSPSAADPATVRRQSGPGSPTSEKVVEARCPETNGLGAYDLDCKNDVTAGKIRPRGGRTSTVTGADQFAVGDKVEYFSTSRGDWIRATVTAVNRTGVLPRLNSTPLAKDLPAESINTRAKKGREDNLQPETSLTTDQVKKHCDHHRGRLLNTEETGRDALFSESSEEDNKGQVFFVCKHDARSVPQPTDGTCLFHALSHGLGDGSDGHTLRQDICDYIKTNRNLEIAGSPLKDWVKYESGRRLDAYTERMEHGKWGGAIEMKVLAQLKGVNVHVFERCSGGYRRISSFDAVGDAKKTIQVVYRGRRHYDALETRASAGTWVPRSSVDRVQQTDVGSTAAPAA